jgi:hypothetical protein
MRRIQLFLEEGVDDHLEAEAVRQGTSKAALIRAAVDARYGSGERGADPIDALIGSLDGPRRSDRESVDDVVYAT